MSIGIHREQDQTEPKLTEELHRELIAYLRVMRDITFAGLTRKRLCDEAPTHEMADAIPRLFCWDCSEPDDETEVRKSEIEWTLRASLRWTPQLERRAVRMEDELKYLRRKRDELGQQYDTHKRLVLKADENLTGVYQEAVYRETLANQKYTKDTHYG